jgi:hypothetical protein
MSESVAKYSAATEQQQASLWHLLWAELKPFPGRDLATLRMAIACTAIVLLSNTFRLPFQDVLPFFALFTAKEEKITTAITGGFNSVGDHGFSGRRHPRLQVYR